MDLKKGQSVDSEKLMNKHDEKKPHPPHHDLPPHIFKELMNMKEKIGRLEGQMDIIIKMQKQ